MSKLLLTADRAILRVVEAKKLLLPDCYVLNYSCLDPLPPLGCPEHRVPT